MIPLSRSHRSASSAPSSVNVATLSSKSAAVNSCGDVDIGKVALKDNRRIVDIIHKRDDYRRDEINHRKLTKTTPIKQKKKENLVHKNTYCEE